MITVNEYKPVENEYIERDNLAVIELAKQLETLTNEPIKITMHDNHLSIYITDVAPIHFRYLAYQKQYVFSLWYHLPYINYDDVNRLEKDMVKPKNIGVLNAKKVADWIAYYKSLYDQLQDLSQEKQLKIKTFVLDFKRTLAELTDKEEHSYFREGMTPSYPDQDQIPDGSYNGCLIRKGIRYEFTIDSNSGYISQKIDIHYSVSNNLDTFIKLSDNKL